MKLPIQERKDKPPERTPRKTQKAKTRARDLFSSSFHPLPSRFCNMVAFLGFVESSSITRAKPFGLDHGLLNIASRGFKKSQRKSSSKKCLRA
jgi:hypothetical protein